MNSKEMPPIVPGENSPVSGTNRKLLPEEIRHIHQNGIHFSSPEEILAAVETQAQVELILSAIINEEALPTHDNINHALAEAIQEVFQNSGFEVMIIGQKKGERICVCLPGASMHELEQKIEDVKIKLSHLIPQQFPSCKMIDVTISPPKKNLHLDDERKGPGTVLRISHEEKSELEKRSN